MNERSGSAAARGIAVFAFAAGGAAIGIGLRAPVPAIAIGAGVLALAAPRSTPGRPLSDVQLALLAYFAAEASCFAGLYLAWHDGFLLVHDALHVAAFYFLARVIVPGPGWSIAIPGCSAASCPVRRARGSAGVAEEMPGAALLLGVIASGGILLAWLLPRGDPVFHRPADITIVAQTVHLGVLPALALVLFSAAAILDGGARLRAIAFRLGLVFTAYACFQAAVDLIDPDWAIAVEETAEFIPLVPLFSVVLGLRARKAGVATDPARLGLT